MSQNQIVMGKILLILRVSTDVQDLEEQKREMIDFAISEGYNMDNIICLEAKGASAIKINDKYQELYNSVEEYVNSGDIECVAVWHLNRLSRDEEWFHKYKKLLTKNKVQLIVKNPALKLLNNDGSINSGMELAFSLFATMSKQEMEEKKEKFKRTKKANAKKGKYNGGHNIRYGYRVDENQFFVIDDVEGKIVSTIFELYSTGKYSGKSLQKEMASRGINMTSQKIVNMIHSDAYCGRPQVKYNNRVYPAIISEELFDLCQTIRVENKIITRRGDKLTLGGKIIKCVECGGTFTSNSKTYACCRHQVLRKCDNSISIKKSIIDPLLWRVASTLHLEYLMNTNEHNIEEYKKEIEIYETKIVVLQDKIDGIEEKKNRVVELYVEGLINGENKTLRLNKINEEVHLWQNEINALNETKNRLYELIENIGKGDDIEILMSALDNVEENEKSMEYRYDVIHKYITTAICKREWFGDNERARKRATKENGIKIEINTIFNNGPWIFMYVPNEYDGCKLWVWNGDEYLKDKEGY